ncbi:bacillithiol system redox-active protein YtxJ [Bacillus sp. DTU_2020_1000418_1_SI_GHA_SEK_038]|uniref:bacillithiol system redox-active protein YtxJ n=1 Tax=Bacillus sp. DTU_2020_1000418_1_SI_GHA_SEK_038 TaxID=3077585 RepID=UPI0028EFCE06|nr:bacillithiol system redox-active protein YtxJ [Bacillus sp. DTU_2020_1000418_1_SI_GHA_SEK_038]WNS74629.1 bacillithiol system redox-active protein YtxJ [Bacillus sp. DTU_2020_1000418_1_SI_GHA_SEK_038]
MKKFNGSEDFEQNLQAAEQFIVLKHSSTCPISQAAYEEYESFASEHENLPIYYLIVQEDRSLSNQIAEKFNIKHESPQVLLFKNGEVIWHASHWKITYDSLTNAIKEHK